VKILLNVLLTERAVLLVAKYGIFLHANIYIDTHTHTRERENPPFFFFNVSSLQCHFNSLPGLTKLQRN